MDSSPLDAIFDNTQLSQHPEGIPNDIYLGFPVVDNLHRHLNNPEVQLLRPKDCLKVESEALGFHTREDLSDRPAAIGFTAALGVEPYLLYFGLLTGATLGGNITPVGASCNIAGVGMLRKEGHEVSFWDFARIGIPFTLTAVLGGYLFVWFVWR